MTDSENLPLGDMVTDATPAAIPRASAHTGTHVQLRPIDPDGDAPALFDASHADGRDWIWTYLPYGPFADVERMRAWMEGIRTSQDPRFFTVCTLPDQHPVGIVSYLTIAPEHRSIEVGHIWYVPQVQRSAVNTESIYLLLRHAFEDLRYRRVEWKCDALNARSCAAAERLGFQAEGVFRQHRINKDRNRDTAWFSIIDSEWPQLRQHFNRWLTAPDGARPSLSTLTKRT